MDLLQRGDVWHNEKMLEFSPSYNELSRPEMNQDPRISQFFEYADTHHNDGVESSLKTLKTVEVVLEALRSSEGVFFDDVGKMYPLIGKQLLVRREGVEVAMEGILQGKEISIDPKGLYPNVAWWDIEHGSEGLSNAFLEGFAQLNGVVVVLGFEPSDRLIVVDQKDIPNEPGVFLGPNGTELNRRFVASAHGTVAPEDIRFAVFRFPYKYFPESEMTGDEVEGGEKNPRGKLQFVFRGVYFPGEEKVPTVH